MLGSLRQFARTTGASAGLSRMSSTASGMTATTRMIRVHSTSTRSMRLPRRGHELQVYGSASISKERSKTSFALRPCCLPEQVGGRQQARAGTHGNTVQEITVCSAHSHYGLQGLDMSGDML